MIEWELPLRLAHKASYLMAMQELSGVCFDMGAGQALAQRIREEMQSIRQEVEPQLPTRQLNKTEAKEYCFPAKPWKADGSWSHHMQRFAERHGLKQVEGGVEYEGKVVPIVAQSQLPKEVPITLDDESTPLKDYFLSQGWEPTFFNQKKDEKGFKVNTSPKFADKGKLCPNLEAMQGEIVKPIVKYLSLGNRLGVLAGKDGDKGWLNHPRLVYDGRLPAGSSGITPTFRQKHTTVCNVPKNKPDVLLGKEFRSLFIAAPGKVLVGWDASSLEDRVKGHWTFKYDGGAYANKILDPEFDPHQENAYTWGLTRQEAKGGTYCVPMDTLCLSRTGWKTYDELEIGEEILGYDPATNTKKWTKVLQKHYVADAEVFEISNRTTKFRATADHRWFVKKFKNYSTGKVNRSIKEAIFCVETTAELKTNSNIVVNAPMDSSQDLISHYSGQIDASKKGTDWVKRVLLMSQRERAAFLEGFMIADGYYYEDSKKWLWTQNKGNLYEAALTATYLVHDGVVQVNNRTDSPNPMGVAKLGKRSHVTCQTIRKTSIGRQPVWCVTTELGSWVIRQGEAITITGNCLAYNGGVATLAKTLKCSNAQAAKYHEAYWRVNKPVKDLEEALLRYWEYEGNKQYIIGLDRRKVHIRKKTALVNTLIQSSASILMDYAAAWIDAKLGGIVFDKDFKPCYNYKGYTARRVLFMHDEYVFECDPEIADDIARLGEESIRAAGRYYKLKVPLESQAQIGKSWAELK